MTILAFILGLFVGVLATIFVVMDLEEVYGQNPTFDEG